MVEGIHCCPLVTDGADRLALRGRACEQIAADYGEMHGVVAVLSRPRIVKLQGGSRLSS